MTGETDDGRPPSGPAAPPGEREDTAPRRSALAQVGNAEQFSVADAIGGPRGIVESAVPGLVFVLVFTFTKDLRASAYAAVAVAGMFAVVRLGQRQTPQHAISGFLGVLLCAWLARHTGKAVDFYLPGLITNVVFGVVFLVSILVRWPLLGLLVGSLTEEGMSWRKSPARMKAYTRASWLWVALFSLRLAVQVPLYFHDNVFGLGIARPAMGWPLWGLAVFASWLILRRVPIEVPTGESVADPGDPEAAVEVPGGEYPPPESRP